MFKVDTLVGDNGLNLVIHNAVIQPSCSELTTVTAEAMRIANEINCIAPLFISRAFLPLLEKAVQAHDSEELNRSVHKAAIIQVSIFVRSMELLHNSYLFGQSLVHHLGQELDYTTLRVNTHYKTTRMKKKAVTPIFKKLK